MSIKVSYLPAGEAGPFKNGATEAEFTTYRVFKKWLAGYVCEHCLEDFKDFHGRSPKTVKDWIWGGCGCEIFIDDPYNMIKWDDAISKRDANEMED